MHVSTAADALPLISPTNQDTQGVFFALGEAHWPGPLTIIVRASDKIPSAVTAHTGSVGIRVPAHPIAKGLLATSKVPIAAPSANRFGHVSPTRCAHVLADLGVKGVHCIDGEFGGIDSRGDDDRACQHGVESTVVKIEPSTRTIQLFRQGAVTRAMLQKTLDSYAALGAGLWNVRVVRRTVEMHGTDKDKAKTVKSCSEIGEGQEAPGQAITHYAPDVPCYTVQSVSGNVIKGTDDNVTKLANDTADVESLNLTITALLESVVVLDFKGCLHACFSSGPFLAYRDLSPRGSHVEAARDLFAALRWAEQQLHAKYILVAPPSGSNNIIGGSESTITNAGAESTSMLAALEDRLFRATSGKVVDIIFKPLSNEGKGY